MRREQWGVRGGCGWKSTLVPSTSLSLACAPFLLCTSFSTFLLCPWSLGNACLSLATHALISPVPRPALQVLLLALVLHSQQQGVRSLQGSRAGFQDPRANQGARAVDNLEPFPDSLTPFRLRRDPSALDPHPLLVDQERSLAVSYTDKKHT